MIPKLQKIISGGQTGVDRAALDAALERRFPCGGWCPKGRRAEDGPLHHRYPLLETPSPDYPLRTESNVRDADGTLILVEDMPSGGTALTVDVSIRLGKPLLVAYLITKPTTAGVIEWLVENDIRVLNVAGPRESQSPGIYAKAFRFIGRLLDDIRDARQTSRRKTAATARPQAQIAQARNAAMSLPLQEAVARAVSEPGADEARAQRLFGELRSVKPSEREDALAAVAAVLTAHDPSARLLRHLARSADPSARLFALELAARLPSPLDRSLLPLFRPLLQDQALPLSAQFAAVVVLLQTTGKRGPAAVELIRTFVTGLDKTHVQERLNALQQRLGKIPALEEMRLRLETKISQRCPRCDQQVQRADLAGHLWREHGLVLDGSFVRDPWSVIEDWVSEAAEKNNPDMLARCFELAQHADPDHGLARLDRSLAAHGIAKDTVSRSADRSAKTSLCPQCATPVSVPQDLPSLRLNVSHGRLSAGGYLVEVSESGRRTRLLIETPEGIVHDDFEPGQRWTRRAALLFSVAPPLLFGFVLSLLLPRPETAVGVSFLAALLAFLFVWFKSFVADAPQDRAFDHAWMLLVPKLHADGFSADDSAFVAGLAEGSGGHGRPHARARSLEQVSALTEGALDSRPDVIGHLALLGRLAIADGARLGRDPVLLLARQLNRCLSGALPLNFADRLLAGWQAGWLTTGNRARLRVLVCAQAFESDLASADLLESGRLAPSLGQLLAVGQTEDLAALHTLWSLRTSRPWERCGEAFAVFNLAEQAGLAGRLLEQCPDLLLYQFLAGTQRGADGPEAILVCRRGVVFGTTLIATPQQARDLAARTSIRVDRLEIWLSYLFGELLPHVKSRMGSVHKKDAAVFRLTAASICPNCGQSLMAKPSGRV